MTANRIRATNYSEYDELSSDGAADQIVGLCAPALVSWKRGTEPPPFTVVNPAAVTLCLQVISGAAVDLPEIFVSEAVAVQVYRLVHDQKAPAKLRASGANGVYVILASLACRELVEADAPAAVPVPVPVISSQKATN